LVTGAGAAARNSIGITVVAGMAFGTLFTLLVIPSIYVLIAKHHVGEERGAIRRGLDLNATAPDDPLSPVRTHQAAPVGALPWRGKGGQAPAKTPARLETGAGQWLNGHHAPAERQIP